MIKNNHESRITKNSYISIALAVLFVAGSYWIGVQHGAMKNDITAVKDDIGEIKIDMKEIRSELRLIRLNGRAKQMSK